MAKPGLDLTREQILAHRRRVGALDERLTMGPSSLERAAFVGLQDSVPRAALLSIHARIAGTEPSTWEDPALVQVWGPRFTAFVVAAKDHALFTVGRHPDDARGRSVAEDMASRLGAFLNGRRMRYDEVGHALGVHPNGLRYATTTGTVLIRWEGARRPVIWTVPRPEIDPSRARIELARRYLNAFGPTSPASFANWAGIGPAQGRAAFDALSNETISVGTPIGDRLLLTVDEASSREKPSPSARARLLPAGDPYFLLWGPDRELLVADARRRPELWTSRVWPGAVLIDGEVVGTWRRANAVVDIAPWRRISPTEQQAVEAEAASMPLAGLAGHIAVRWDELAPR
jgi:hypothetical protein